MKETEMIPKPPIPVSIVRHKGFTYKIYNLTKEEFEFLLVTHGGKSIVVQRRSTGEPTALPLSELVYVEETYKPSAEARENS